MRYAKTIVRLFKGLTAALVLLPIVAVIGILAFFSAACSSAADVLERFGDGVAYWADL